MPDTNNKYFCLFSTRLFSDGSLFGKSEAFPSDELRAFYDDYLKSDPDFWAERVKESPSLEQYINNSTSVLEEKDVPDSEGEKFDLLLKNVISCEDNSLYNREKVIKSILTEGQWSKLKEVPFLDRVLLDIVRFGKTLVNETVLERYKEFIIKRWKKIISDEAGLRGEWLDTYDDGSISLHISNEDKDALLKESPLLSLYVKDNEEHSFYAVHCLENDKHKENPKRWIATLISIAVNKGSSNIQLFLHDKDVNKYGGCDLYVASKDEVDELIDKNEINSLTNNSDLVNHLNVNIVFFQHTGNAIARLLNTKECGDVKNVIDKALYNYEWRKYLVGCMARAYDVDGGISIPNCPISVGDSSKIKYIIGKTKDFEGKDKILKSLSIEKCLPTQLYSASFLNSLPEEDRYCLLRETIKQLS